MKGILELVNTDPRFIELRRNIIAEGYLNATQQEPSFTLLETHLRMVRLTEGWSIMEYELDLEDPVWIPVLRSDSGEWKYAGYNSDWVGKKLGLFRQRLLELAYSRYVKNLMEQE